jgi:hypothetical protein
VTGGLEQALCGLDGPARVFGPGHPLDKQANHLVPNQAVDQRIALDQHIRRDPVKAVDEAAELERTHPLRQGSRAAQVGKEHADDDLRAAWVFKLRAGLAIAGIVAGLVAPRQVHHEAAPSFKWRSTQLAAGTGRQQAHQMAEAADPRLAFGQPLIPQLLHGFFVWHRISLPIHSTANHLNRTEIMRFAGACGRRGEEGKRKGSHEFPELARRGRGKLNREEDAWAGVSPAHVCFLMLSQTRARRFYSKTRRPSMAGETVPWAVM